MRRRLITVAAAISLMVAIAFLVPLIVLVRTIARDRAITSAERDAAALAPALAVSTDRSAISVTDRITVVLPSGEQIGNPIPRDNDLALAQSGTSFSTNQPDGVAVFMPVLSSAGTSVVRVFVSDAEIHKGVTRATWSLIGLGVALVVGAVVVSDRLGASMVRPVRRLSEAAERLGDGDLSQRVDPEGPKEVAAVAQAFNLLAQRVGDLLAAERELVADLSHRLRTPLTVLRLEADALRDPDARVRVQAAADELEHAVTSLIAEARRPITSEVGVQGDLAAVTEGRVTFWRALAEDQGRRFDADIASGPIAVAATDAELEAALDALLGNVFDHTFEGTRLTVTLQRVDVDRVVLTVADAGVGFDESVVARGRSGGGSSGLGLDIARRTVERAGGELQIARSELGGASISLTFPSSRR